MKNILRLYQNATANAQDGTEISMNGTFTSPIDITLDGSINEVQIIPLAVRTLPGYEVVGTCGIAIVGDAEKRFSLSTAQNGTFSTSISLSSVGDTNKIFYLKAVSADTDYPHVIRSAAIKATAATRFVS